MIKIGQIGIGHNHSDKLEPIKKHPELFELVGYAEENEEWVARRGSKPHFADVPRLSVEEVIEKSDAILVETDIWDLTKTAQMCLDAGKHVHMDKPASGTLAEFKHLLDTAKAKNLVLQMGYTCRYNPAIIKLLEMIKNGELGDISAIHAEMSVVHPPKYRAWLKNFAGGDMYIFGSHLIDLIVYILGKPNRVLSSMVSSNEDQVESQDVTAAILEYDHALARVFSSSVEWNGWARRCFSVSGSLGTVHIQPMEGPSSRMIFSPKHDGPKYTTQDNILIDLPQTPDLGRFGEIILPFHDYIVGKKENPFSYEHEYAVQEVLSEVVGGIRMLGTDIG